MAYPVPAAHRIQYDINGTDVYFIRMSDVSVTEVTGDEDITELNDETDDRVWYADVTPGGKDPGSSLLVFMFPQPMDITHLWWRAGTHLTADWSANTTDGIDGDWTSLGTQGRTSDATPINYRSPVELSSPTDGAKAIRFSGSWTSGSNHWLYTIHMYGEPSDAPEALDLWHPTEDRRPTPAELNMGVIQQGNNGTMSFRVKNLGSSFSTDDVIVSAEGVTDSTYAAVVEFSLDGESWTSTVNVGDLDPGDVSAVVQARLPVSEIATLGPKTFRVLAEGSEAE